MPFANRMSYTISTTQFDIEHDQKSPRTTSQSDTLKQEAALTLSTKNDTTIAKAERNHIKVGSSMILNMQRAPHFHKTTCCDLLLKGYLRSHHKDLLHTLPLDIFPLLIDYLDPLLVCCRTLRSTPSLSIDLSTANSQIRKGQSLRNSMQNPLNIYF